MAGNTKNIRIYTTKRWRIRELKLFATLKDSQRSSKALNEFRSLGLIFLFLNCLVNLLGYFQGPAGKPAISSMR